MTEARLELVWPGKDKFLLVPKDTDGKPVWVERDHPAASEVRLADFTDVVGDVPEDPYAANLLFTGDSLDVLRILCEVPEYRSIYRGKVKRRGKHMGKRSNWKKAIVKLREGETIQLFEGV